jgi:DNA-binding NarL/FixJ family response regulator
MYKLLFIDEEESAHNDFRYYVKQYHDSDITVEVMHPLQSIKEMVDAILKSDLDALITDFKLNEYRNEIVTYNVPYNGVELVKEFSSIRTGFPCFVMTTFGAEAVPASDDANIVYVKNELHQYNSDKKKSSITFLDRVKAQINRYRKRIADAENEIEKLVGLRKKGATTMLDEARILELDGFLEKALDGRTLVPAEYKGLSNTKKLTELISQVDKFIKSMEGKNETVS